MCNFRSITKRIIGVTLLISYILIPIEILACGCNTPEPEANFYKSDFVFVGKAINVIRPISRYYKYGINNSDCGNKTALFKSKKVLKGDIKGQIKIYSEDSCAGCGLYIDQGEEYLIYAYKDKDGNYHTDTCTSSGPLKYKQKEVEKLVLMITKINELENNIKHNPDRVEPLLEKAAYFEFLKDNNEALKNYRLAVAIDNKNAIAYKKIVEILFNLKKYDEVISIANNALKYNENDNGIINKKNISLIYINGPKGLDLRDTEFKNEKFSGIDFSNTDLSGTIINRVVFVSSNLQNVNFTNAKIVNSTFNGTSMEGANFNNATLEISSFYKTDLRKIKNFNTTKFQQVSFNEVILDGVNLSWKDLTDTMFNKTSMIGANFDNSIFYRTSFYNSNLEQSSFKNADLNYIQANCSNKWPKDMIVKTDLTHCPKD